MVEATDELRERLAKALHEAQCGCPTWVVKDLEDTQYDDMAAAIMPLVVAVVAEARTEALRDAESAIIEVAPPLNAELSMRGGDGPFTDKLMESYIEGFHDAHSAVAALRGVGNQKVGVTVDDLALDEMDGNQNAEPRWSANRLEEVLREGLPDQNAEPEDKP
jgi:hypothetical protein